MSPTRPNSPINLIQVADRQRQLIWLILLSIASFIGVFGAIPIVQASGLTAFILVAAVSVILFQLLALIQTFRLAASMKSGYIMPILLVFGIFIPLLGLIILLLISGQANSLFKNAGVKVGFLGVPKSEYPKMIKGNCPGCGYSRDGLELLQECPECGRTPQVH